MALVAETSRLGGGFFEFNFASHNQWPAMVKTGVVACLYTHPLKNQRGNHARIKTTGDHGKACMCQRLVDAWVSAERTCAGNVNGCESCAFCLLAH